MAKTIKEWTEEIGEEADAKGFWTPQCKHEATTTINNAKWCNNCGGIYYRKLLTDQEEWTLPKLATERNVGEVFMLFVTEIAEAFEEHRGGHAVDEVYFNAGSQKPEGQPVEIVDAIIRMIDWLGHKGVDTEAVMTAKFAYNKSRPYRHGGKLA